MTMLERQRIVNNVRENILYCASVLQNSPQAFEASDEKDLQWLTELSNDLFNICEAVTEPES